MDPPRGCPVPRSPLIETVKGAFRSSFGSRPSIYKDPSPPRLCRAESVSYHSSEAPSSLPSILKGKEQCGGLIEAHYACLLTEGFTKEQVDRLRATTN